MNQNMSAGSSTSRERDGLAHNKAGLWICGGSKNELAREISSDLLSHREAREAREGKTQ
jgi:hypothetical protein